MVVTAAAAPPETHASDDAEVIGLARALRSHVDVASGREPVRHCRGGVRGWSRCDARLEAFARLFVGASRRHGTSPHVLAAIAVGESGLNPAAVGARGEIGILQLHPRGVGRVLVHARPCDEGRVDGCQGPVVELGAQHLAAWQARCGSVGEALGGYNRGRCGVTPYAERVLARAGRLAAAARAAQEPDGV